MDQSWTPSRSVFRFLTPSLRPPRFAIGIPRSTSLAEVAALLQRMTATWGGVNGSLAFPVEEWTPGSRWDRLLDRFDADHFLFLEGHSLPGETIRDRYDPLWLFEDRWLFQASALSGPGVTAVERAMRLEVNSGGQPPIDIAEPVNGPSWAHVVAANNAGYLLPAFTTNISTQVTRMKYDLDDPDAAFAFLNAAVFSPQGNPPNAISRWGLARVVKGPTVFGNPSPIVVAGGSLADVCLWIALRAIQGPDMLHWLPEDATTTDTLARWYRTMVADQIHNSVSAWGKPCVVTSASKSAPQALALASALVPTGGRLAMPEWREPVAASETRERSWYSLTRHETTYREEFREGLGLRLLDVPTPPELNDSPNLGIHFLVEVSIEGYSCPTHQGVRPLIDRDFAHRSGRYGVVFDALPALHIHGDKLAHEIRRPALLLPNEHQVAVRLGIHTGSEVRPSPSGLALRTIVDRLGGAQLALKELLCGPLASIWNDHEHGTPRRGRYALPQRRIVWTAEALNGLDGHSNDTWTSKMCRAQVLRAGLALKCDYCGRLDLYEWGDMGWGSQRCRYCREPLSIDPRHSPCWAPLFGVDPILVHALRLDCLEELALVVVLAHQADRNSLSLGTEWSRPNAEVEVDVIGSLAGLTVVGEAKSINAIDGGQINRLANLAERIQARKLIFATSKAAWDEATLGRIRAIDPARGFDTEVIVDLLAAARGVVCDRELTQ